MNLIHTANLKKIITIDGPAGAGKTSVSKALAKRLGCMYVDTGALYRGLAYEIHKCGIDWQNDTLLEEFLGRVRLDLIMKGDSLTLISSGKDISDFIRTPEISLLASAISANPLVRKSLLNIQRNLAENNDAVFEGRDMGTVVFPRADFKFFLHADIETRAQRRHQEGISNTQNIEDVKKDIKTRDKNDRGRKHAPLKPADDAVMIDSTNLTLDEVVDLILKHMEKSILFQAD